MKKIKALWLEDDLETPRISIESLLPVWADEGYTTELEFEVTSSLEDAIEICRGGNVDLLISDNHMPAKLDVDLNFETMGGARTGISVAKRIREFDERLPILIVTAYSSFEYDRAFMSANRILVAQKPLSGRDLVRCLEDALGSKISKEGKALDAFELKPGAFGFKVDLKKAGKLLRKK